MDERYYYGIRQEAAYVLTKVPLYNTNVDGSVQ
jgi:hypothetical protein